MLDIKSLLTCLAKDRKVFHSEADFQHAFAWHIHQTIPDSQIRLEVPMPVEDRRIYVDIYLPQKKIAIELKYVTRGSELEDNKESFALLNQGAQNQRRYDFLLDIHRLERLRSNPELCKAGYAILLTNDPLYWNEPRRHDTVDTNFRIHEGREIYEELAWTDNASEGTKRGRDKAIPIGRPYRLCWQDYSNFPEKPFGKFRYLAVSVH